MKVSLFTIGTEITSGEILNSNAQWLSDRLETLGHETVCHLTVPDRLPDILRAFDYLRDCDLIVVTGGLGPTQDDMTREAVAQWCGDVLEFSSWAWEDLVDRMRSRGREPMEAHKHQCQFPVRSTVLKNTTGSAHGFWVSKGAQKLAVLPGPPKELQPMWLDEVEPLLPVGDLSPWVKWKFEGLPESVVADRFERLLMVESVDPRTVEIGYRASLPFIHVKVRRSSVPLGFEERVIAEFGAALVELPAAPSRER